MANNDHPAICGILAASFPMGDEAFLWNLCSVGACVNANFRVLRVLRGQPEARPEQPRIRRRQASSYVHANARATPPIPLPRLPGAMPQNGASSTLELPTAFANLERAVIDLRLS